jgi:hypothetical protein
LVRFLHNIYKPLIMRNFILFFLFNLFSFAQDIDSKIEADILYSQSQLFDKTFHGLSFGVSGAWKENIYVGAFVNLQFKNTNPSHFIVQDPLVTHVDFGIQIKKYLVRTNRFHLSPFLINSWGITSLQDQSITEIVETEFGPEERAVTIERNHLFLVQAGVDLQFRLADSKRGPQYFLSTRAAYRTGFGRLNYGFLSDYQGLYFGVGLTLKYQSFSF